MIGTFLYVVGSSERHSKLKNRDVHPFETDVVGSSERHSKLKNRDVHPFETDTKGRDPSSLTFL